MFFDRQGICHPKQWIWSKPIRRRSIGRKTISGMQLSPPIVHSKLSKKCCRKSSDTFTALLNGKLSQSSSYFNVSSLWATATMEELSLARELLAYMTTHDKADRESVVGALLTTFFLSTAVHNKLHLRNIPAENKFHEICHRLTDVAQLFVFLARVRWAS